MRTHTVELMKELQGDATRAEFSSIIGVAGPLISMIYHGKRNPGLGVFGGLVRAFPEREAEIVNAFLADMREE